MKIAVPPFVRLLVAVVVVFAQVPLATLASANAQSGTTDDPYVSELVDWRISVSGPQYVFENAALEQYPHGRGERVFITSLQNLGFVEIAFFDDTDTAEQSIDIMLRDFSSASTSFAVIAEGNEGDLYYAMARFEIDRTLTGYFYVEIAENVSGNIDVLQSIYSLNADFLEQLDIARDEIDMDGISFLADPAADLETLIREDERMLAATPVRQENPHHGTFKYRFGDATLDVREPIDYDFALTTTALDVKFLKSEHGYGVIGYVKLSAGSAEDVLASFFSGAPTGSIAPVELFLESDAQHALGVYRVSADADVRIMVIEVKHMENDTWTVEAMAVSETEFAAEFQLYQQAVSFNGAVFMDGVSADDIVTILNESD